MSAAMVAGQAPPAPAGTPSPSLAVIGAGFGRTGTLSLREALRQLGFWPCEHALNSAIHPERHALWLEAIRRKQSGEPIDWRPLFAGYRATLDWPAAYFWRELVAAHPEAKVILTVRDAERWYASLHATSYARLQARTQTLKGRAVYGLLSWLDRSRAQKYQSMQEAVWDGTFGGRFAEREHAIRVFDEHIRAVQETVPADRLLIFDVKGGWEPLCAFLGVPAPSGEPFPHINSAAEYGRVEPRHIRALARALLPPLGAAAGGGAAGLLVGGGLGRVRDRARAR